MAVKKPYKPVTQQETVAWLAQQEANRSNRHFGGFKASNAAAQIAGGQRRISESVERHAKRAARGRTLGSVWNIATAVVGAMNPLIAAGMGAAGGAASYFGMPEPNDEKTAKGQRLMQAGHEALSRMNPSNISRFQQGQIMNSLGSAQSMAADTQDYVARKAGQTEGLETASAIAGTAAGLYKAGSGVYNWMNPAQAVGSTGADFWKQKGIDPRWLS